MELTKTWTCDRCFKPIEGVEDGWMEWLNSGTGQDFRNEKMTLVHTKNASPLTESSSGCQYDHRAVFVATGGIIANLPLQYFIGADGQMQLLRFLEEGRFPQAEVLEMFKRLHIPGYEHARHYFEEAIAADALEPNTQLGYHHQYQIEATLRYLEERDSG